MFLPCWSWGGSHGLGPLTDIVFSLCRLPIRLQTLVVCGNNRKLFKRMQAEFSDNRSVKIFGHTRNVPRLMDAADLLISKPGGLTTSEAMAKGLPMITINPIPGQEERNARYLHRHGAAEGAETLEDLVQRVQDLFTHRDRLENLRGRVLALARPHAAYAAAESVLNILGEPVFWRPE